MQTFSVSFYDVWADPDGGWVGNYSVHSRMTLEVPDGLSDRAIEMRARSLANFTGRRAIRECDGCVTRWVDSANAVACELDWGH